MMALLVFAMHYTERQHSFSNISIASELGLELATGADVPGSGGGQMPYVLASPPSHATVYYNSPRDKT